jgi:hypothetical protein
VDNFFFYSKDQAIIAVEEKSHICCEYNKHTNTLRGTMRSFLELKHVVRVFTTWLYMVNVLHLYIRAFHGEKLTLLQYTCFL